MTLATLGRDAGAQMHRVGLPGFKPQHAYARSRADNNMHSGLRPACDVPPTSSELNRLVSATWWDAILYEFASVLAARRAGLCGAARECRVFAQYPFKHTLRHQDLFTIHLKPLASQWA